MARRRLYPEGSATSLNLTVRKPIKAALVTIADRNRQSVSQLVMVMIEDYLMRRGELPLPEREEAAV